MNRPETRRIKGFRESDEKTIFFLTEGRELLLSARSSPHAVRGAALGLGSSQTDRGSFVVSREKQTIQSARVAQG